MAPFNPFVKKSEIASQIRVVGDILDIGLDSFLPFTGGGFYSQLPPFDVQAVFPFYRHFKILPLKTSKLTPEEEKEIQAHPRVGAKILEPANLPQEVVETVLYHHENYNGGGYPEGIAGEKIPLLARIIRVVDSYDAMKSDRTYRKVFSQKWVIEELSRCSGKQFDPAVVETVKKLIEQGKLT